MVQEINVMTEKIFGPDAIDQTIFDKYGVDNKQAIELYNSYRLYSRILQCARKAKENKEEIRIKNKVKYYCELCDKDVRCCIRYHHERTQKHLKFKQAVEDSLKIN